MVQESPILGLRPLRDMSSKVANLVAEGDAKVGSSQRLEISSPGPIDSPVGGASREITTLKYQFEAGWKFLRVVGNGLIPPLTSEDETPAKKLGLWIYGDAKGCQPRLRFLDSTGQCFQSDGQKIDWTGWRYVTFPLQATGSGPLAHWGGANDGKIHYPIKWDTIFLLDNVSRRAIDGQVYLSAPTLIY